MESSSRKKSPRYPSISLDDAIVRAREIYDRERTNFATRDVLAKILGYSGITGKSAGVLGSLRQFGLLTGRGEQLRLSEIAVDLIHAPVESGQYQSALRSSFGSPELYNELLERFPDGQVSDENLKYFFVKKGFSSDTISAAIREFRRSLDFYRSQLLPESTFQITDKYPPDSEYEAEQKGRDLNLSSKSLGSSRFERQEREISTHPKIAQHVERTVLTDGVTVELIFSREPVLEDLEALGDYVMFRKKQMVRISGRPISS